MSKIGSIKPVAPFLLFLISVSFSRILGIGSTQMLEPKDISGIE